MTHNRPFAQVDVFSQDPCRGNPVAANLDAEDLSDEEMARIANRTNLSETAFVLPPTDPADYRLPVFTSTRDLPFASHPILSSAAAWPSAGGVTHTESTLVQECGAGLAHLRRGVPSDAGTTETLTFAAPEPIRSGDFDEDDEIRVGGPTTVCFTGTASA